MWSELKGFRVRKAAVYEKEVNLLRGKLNDIRVQKFN
jgi:hypothetical protein